MFTGTSVFTKANLYNVTGKPTVSKVFSLDKVKKIILLDEQQNLMVKKFKRLTINIHTAYYKGTILALCGYEVIETALSYFVPKLSQVTPRGTISRI